MSTQTGNNSPEEQKAYIGQLERTIDSIDVEIEYFEQTLDSHQKSIDRWKAWAERYPRFAGVLGPFINRFVAQTEANINATQNNIALLQQQRAQLIENRNQVGPVSDESIATVEADEKAKHPRAEGPDAETPEDTNPQEV